MKATNPGADEGATKAPNPGASAEAVAAAEGARRLLQVADEGATKAPAPSAEARVKVCGMTRLQDAHLAVELGAWAVGFIFHTPSPRDIAPARAREIVEALPAHVRKVGVVVNRSASELAKLWRDSGVDTLQLHGEESPALLDELAAVAPSGARVWKAYRPRRREDLAGAEAFPRHALWESFLIDAFSADAHGGTGLRANVEFAGDLQRLGPLILSGGLKPDNVAEAARAVRPWALDVSSGVESAPGRKDPAKLRAFFEAVKGMTA